MNYAPPPGQIIAARGQRGRPTPSIRPCPSGEYANALPRRIISPGRRAHGLRTGGVHVGAPGPASSVSDEETIMTMLKRMRPEELREVSKAATALEKTKLEERRRKKIKAEEKKKVGDGVGR